MAAATESSISLSKTFAFNYMTLSVKSYFQMTALNSFESLSCIFFWISCKLAALLSLNQPFRIQDDLWQKGLSAKVARIQIISLTLAFHISSMYSTSNLYVNNLTLLHFPAINISLHTLELWEEVVRISLSLLNWFFISTLDWICHILTLILLVPDTVDEMCKSSSWKSVYFHSSWPHLVQNTWSAIP